MRRKREWTDIQIVKSFQDGASVHELAAWAYRLNSCRRGLTHTWLATKDGLAAIKKIEDVIRKGT